MAVEFSRRTERVRRLYAARGARHYGEGVSQTQHAVQSYRLAVSANAHLELRIAAFLHDIGHLLVPEKDQGVHKAHEQLGSLWLKSRGFSDLVVNLVQSHVWAKRYLASDPSYYAQLSEPSKDSLVLQGGPMSEPERLTYQGLANFHDALSLRRWDDLAKDASDLMSSQIPDEVWSDFTLYDQKFPL